MSDVISSVLDRKRARANLSNSIVKAISFGILAILAALFKWFLDSILNHLGSGLSGTFGFFAIIEVISIFRFFIARPISLTEAESKLLKAKGVDFVKAKPKPELKTPRVSADTSLSSCLLNRSHDASLNLASPETKKTPPKTTLRKRLNSPIANRSINSDHELETYLDSFNSPSCNETILLHEQPKKPWTSPLRSLEPLTRFEYQLSKSPPTTKTNDSIQDFGKSSKESNAWEQLGVSQDSVNNWSINLRKYLWGTIVHPLVKEIKNVNKNLKVSLPDVQIGKTSISELRMISSPALSNEIRRIIPYLELCTNHAYLIERLETLSSGGYLSKYVWDGGQEFNGRPWSKENPTDSAILVHLLSCWLDTHLPPDPAAGPEARACTDRFIRKAKPVDIKDAKSKSAGKKIAQELSPKIPVALVEHSISPPEYFVQFGKEIKEIPSGRGNPLQAILLMFYLLHKKNEGEMAGVFLGQAGINMLSIFKE